MLLSQRKDWRCLRPGDTGAHFTHGASLLHLHSSGQMRETYGFWTWRSIPSNVLQDFITSFFNWKYDRPKRTTAFVWRKRLKVFFLKRGNGSSRELWVRQGVCDKACEASVSSQSSSSTSLSAELQLSPRVLRVSSDWPGKRKSLPFMKIHLWKVKEFKFLTSRILIDLQLPLLAFWVKSK